MTNSTNPAKSTISRSWKSTVNSLIIALVSAGISVVLFLTIASGPVTVGIALIPAVVAIIFIFSAISGAGECACPNCAAPLTGISTGANDGVLCRKCLRYFEGKNGELWATEESRIADSPTFAAPLPDPVSFPEGCCVCGKPSTHQQKIQLVTTNASSAVTESTIGLTTRTRTSIDVPHCDEHKDGALLTGTQKSIRIRFRSYPYLRAYCVLNNTNPS